MLKLGLTGGIAAVKSVVGEMELSRFDNLCANSVSSVVKNLLFSAISAQPLRTLRFKMLICQEPRC